MLCAGQEGVFIRNDGRVDLRIGPGQIAVIDELEPVRRVLHRGFVDGRVKLRRITVGQVDAVVVLFPQHVQERHGFEPSEAVPQRELVERVGLKFCHELTAQDRRERQLRLLRELPPFADGDGVIRLAKPPEQKPGQEGSR